jgi:hypothetical protein
VEAQRSSSTTRSRSRRGREDTLLAAYLIEPGRASYELDDLAAEYGDRARCPAPPTADEETVALVRAKPSRPRRSAPVLLRCSTSATSPRSTGRSSCR